MSEVAPPQATDTEITADATTETAVAAATGKSVRDTHGDSDATTIDETITFETHSGASAASARTVRRRIRPWVWWTASGLTLVLAGLAASWFLLPIKQVEVTGNRHLTVAQVKQLAGIRSRMGWLYYGPQRARGLLSDPWVESAVVTRQFPDRVTVAITERQPFLKLARPSGETEAISKDGKLLPDAPNLDSLPTVSGWGPERLADAVLVARALSRYTVQSVAYTPTGLTVKTAGATVWSGDLKSLVKYAGSISMYPNQNINIYPWGVSVQQ